MVILATRIAGGGMDPRLVERMPELEAWSSPFLKLSRDIDTYAVNLVNQAPRDCEAALALVDACIDRPDDDDCLATTEERAWSSPIFVEWGGEAVGGDAA